MESSILGPWILSPGAPVVLAGAKRIPPLRVVSVRRLGEKYSIEMSGKSGGASSCKASGLASNVDRKDALPFASLHSSSIG